MKLARWTSSALLALLLAMTGAFLTGCEDDDNGTGPESRSAVSGHVYGDEEDAAENATVSLARINANGTLQTVSVDSVVTDEDGEYLVLTTADRERHLVVVAEEGDDTWMAVVPAEVRRNQTVTAPPVTVESTAEAQVYQEVVAADDDGIVSYVDVALLIDADLAARVVGDEGDIATLAAAVAAAGEAQARLLGNTHFGLTAPQVLAIRNARMNAFVDLSEDLDAAGTDDGAIDEAYDAYFEAERDALEDAGVSRGEIAAMLEVTNAVWISAIGGLESDAEFDAARTIALRRARASQGAMLETFNALGATPAAIAAVTTAGSALETSLQGAVSIDQIESAFETYRLAVRTELVAGGGAQATALGEAHADINAPGGAREDLESALDSATTVEARVNAFIAFFEAVQDEVDDELSGASQGVKDAAVRTLILINVVA